MKMNVKMKPRGCVIEKSRPRLYPKAGFGSGNFGNLLFCFLPERQSATVMQDSNNSKYFSCVSFETK